MITKTFLMDLLKIKKVNETRALYYSQMLNTFITHFFMVKDRQADIQKDIVYLEL